MFNALIIMLAALAAPIVVPLLVEGTAYSVNVADVLTLVLHIIMQVIAFPVCGLVTELV
jgi:hypothetical protein